MDLFILKNMMKEATCFICQKLMTDSTSIDCGHSYCHLCIVNVNEGKSVTLPLRTYFCPQCHTPIKSTSLRPNKQLQNIIKMLKEMDLGDLCEKHGDVLHLFCEDDGQFICCYCELSLSRKHRGHTILSIRTCQVYKQKLLETVEKLRDMENQCKSMMTSIEQQITECAGKILLQKQKVQSDFKNLKDFLHEEEKSYLWRLEKEKEKVLQRLKDNEASLEKQSQELQKHIQQLEEKCQGSDEILLQDVKDTLKRSSAIKLDLPEPVSLSLEITCNVSKLYFDVKKIAKRYQESQEPASSGSTVPIPQSSGVSPGLDKTEGSWVCKICEVQNRADRTKCIACEEAKPNAQSACQDIATSSLSSKSAAPLYTCGTPTTSSGIFQTLFKTGNFQFGKPEVSWPEQHSDRVFTFRGVSPEDIRLRRPQKTTKKREIKPEAFKLGVSSDSGSIKPVSGSFSFSKVKEDFKFGIALDSKSEEAKESQTKENFKFVPLSSSSNATSGTHFQFGILNFGQQEKKEKLPQSSCTGFTLGTANPTSTPDSKKDSTFGTLETKSISTAPFTWKIPEATPKTMLEVAVGNPNPAPVPPATKFVGGWREKKEQKPVTFTSQMFGENTGNKLPAFSFRISESTKDKSSSKSPFCFSLRNPTEKESKQPALTIFPLEGQTSTSTESQEPSSSGSTVPIPQFSGVSPGLNKTESSWVCKMCVEQNTADCTKCVACYGAKSGAQSACKDVTTSLSNTGNFQFGKPEVFKLGVSADSGSTNPPSGSFSFSEVKKDVKLGFPLDSKSEEAKESQTKENFKFVPPSLSNGISETPFQVGAPIFGQQEKKEKLPPSSSTGFTLGTANHTLTPESKKDCTFETLGTKSISPAPFTWKTPKAIPKTTLGVAAPVLPDAMFVEGWTEKKEQKPVTSTSLMFGANTGNKEPIFSFGSSEPTKDQSSSKSSFCFSLRNLSEKESEQPALAIFPLEGQTTTPADITTSLSNTGNFQFGKPEVFKLGVSADSGSTNPTSGSFSFSEVKKDVKLGIPLDSKSEEAKESQTKENFKFVPPSLSSGLSETPFQVGAPIFGQQEKKEKLPPSSSTGFTLGTANPTSTPKSKKDCTLGILRTKSISPAPLTSETTKAIPKTTLGVAAPVLPAAMFVGGWTEKKEQNPVTSTSLMFGANTGNKEPIFSFGSSEPTKDQSSSKSSFCFSLRNLSEKESEQPALAIFPLEGQTTTPAESTEPVSSRSTVPISQSSGFSLGSDKTEASRDCKTCLVQNKADHNICVEGEESKPSSQSACKESPEPVSSCSIVPKSESSGVSLGLDKTEGSWVCYTCLGQNTADCTKCVICKGSKPGTQSACKDVAASFLSSK